MNDSRREQLMPADLQPGSRNDQAAPTRFDDVEPVFVVGFPRSGTTLLQVMLDAHPRLALLTEVHFFSEILQIRSTVPTLDTAADLTRFLELVRRCGHFRRLIDGEQLLAEVERKLIAWPRRSYELFYRLLLEENGRIRGAARFGEKTPVNVRYLDDLVAIFPRARIVHIIRDPRAAVASALRMPWYPKEVVTNSLKWYLDVRAAKLFAEKHPDLIYEVRYEDLVSEPRRELERICDFLGESFDERMLQYHEGAEQVVSMKHEPWSKGITSPLYKERVASWERELSPSQIYVIDWITRSCRERAGYAAVASARSSRWVLPLVLAQSVIRYIPFKLKQSWLSRKGLGETGETKRLYRMLTGRLTSRSR
jgi:Sulfotransferase family